MFKLIKMDFYRLMSSKSIKVGMLMSCILVAVYMLFSLLIVEIVKMGISQGDADMVAGLSDMFAQVSWVVTGKADLADIIFGTTGAFSLFVGCMVASSFIGSEQSCGYTKNFAGQLSNKGYMAISKFVVTSVAHIIVVAVYIAAAAAISPLLFGQYINGFTADKFLAAVGVRILLHLAINAIITFLCTLTKSHAVSMVAGSIFGIGVTHLAYLAASSVLHALHFNIFLGDYMPDGINFSLSLGSVDTLYVKAIAVSVAFIVVFVAANYFVVKKRDVR